MPNCPNCGRCSRRTGWIPACTVALVLALTLGAVGCGPPPPPPRLIVLVTVDTLRADHLSLHGYPWATSPFLEELGESAVVFDNALSSSSHTGPSHAALFTGLQPSQHRLESNGEALGIGIRTLAGELRTLGYRTAAFPAVAFLGGLDVGFDDFHAVTGRPPHAEDAVDMAIDYIGAHPDGKLFVWLHLFDVHQWNDDRDIDPAAVDAMAASRDSGELIPYLTSRQGMRLVQFDAAHMADVVNRYDSQIVRVDRGLRRLWQTVDSAAGAAGPALLVVTADHGEGLQAHEYMGHGQYLYDEQLHVPLIVRASDGRFPAHRVSELVRLVDLSPTIMAIAGGTFEQMLVPVQGQSLMPLLSQRRGFHPQPAFAERRPADDEARRGWLQGDVFALSDGNTKVIHNPDGKHEVFDLAADPLELDNRAGQMTDDQQRLFDAMERLQRSLVAQGEKVESGDINPAFIEELRALGYIHR